MSAQVTAPTLTSDTVLFSNRAAAQAFFNNFTVADATLTVPGVVYKGAAISFTDVDTYEADNYVVWNISGDSHTLPTRAVTDELREKITYLSGKIEALLTSLRSAGTINS